MRDFEALLWNGNTCLEITNFTENIDSYVLHKIWTENNDDIQRV